MMGWYPPIIQSGRGSCAAAGADAAKKGQSEREQGRESQCMGGWVVTESATLSTADVAARRCRCLAPALGYPGAHVGGVDRVPVGTGPSHGGNGNTDRMK